MTDPGRFSPEPETLHDYVRSIWHDLRDVKSAMTSDRARLDAVERAVRDLQVFTTWVFKLLPVLAVVITVLGLMTR